MRSRSCEFHAAIHSLAKRSANPYSIMPSNTSRKNDQRNCRLHLGRVRSECRVHELLYGRVNPFAVVAVRHDNESAADAFRRQDFAPVAATDSEMTESAGILG